MPGTPTKSEDSIDVVNELASFASTAQPDHYFQRFLELSSRVANAQASIFWALNQQGKLTQLCNLGEAGDRDRQLAPGNVRLNMLLEALHTGCEITREFRDSKFPHARHVHLKPIKTQQDCIAVVEIFLTEPMTDKQHSTIHELGLVASGYIQRLRTAESSQPTSQYLAHLDDFIRRIHQSHELKRVASTAVNELRRILVCDRCFIATSLKGKASIVAISCQDRISQRSNLMRALQKLANESLLSRTSIQFQGDVSTVPGNLQASLVDYLAESGCLQLAVIPLFAPAAINAESHALDTDAEPIAVLIVEQLSGPVNSNLFHQSEHASGHLALAVFHAMEREQIFLLSLRRFVGRSVRAMANLKAIVVLGLLAAAGLCFAFVPMTYRVEANGKLMPTLQARVFAPYDGEIEQVLVSGGERVEAGQPLLKIVSDDLTMNAMLIQNQLMEKRQLQNALLVEKDTADGLITNQDRIRLNGRIAQASIEAEGLQQRLSAFHDQMKDCTLLAKISGTIVTLQPESLLAGRPVRQGQMLLEIMEDRGEWQLKLNVPAKRLGNIQAAKIASGGADLPVQFVLATHPEKTMHGHLTKSSTRAEELPSGELVIPFSAAIDQAEPVDRTVNAGVFARIDCGKRPLGYVLFGDAIDWIRQQIW